MSDVRLRELERRWRESGDAQDEAALLRERLRIGDVDPEALALCAYLGHPAARAVREPPQEAQPWQWGLIPFGQEVLVRAAIAAARRRMPEWKGAFPDERKLELSLRRAERWADCPCKACAAKSSGEHTELSRRYDDVDPQSPAGRALGFVGGALWVSLERHHTPGRSWEVRARALRTFAPEDRAAVRDELVPWCLGTGDPVRGRVINRWKTPRA